MVKLAVLFKTTGLYEIVANMTVYNDVFDILDEDEISALVEKFKVEKHEYLWTCLPFLHGLGASVSDDWENEKEMIEKWMSKYPNSYLAQALNFNDDLGDATVRDRMRVLALAYSNEEVLPKGNPEREAIDAFPLNQSMVRCAVTRLVYESYEHRMFKGGFRLQRKSI